MHELPLCESVRDAVVSAANGRRVLHIAVEVGARHAATADAFQTLFTQAASGTVAADATVTLTTVDATYECGCGAVGIADPRLPLCDACDEPVRPRGGDELAVTAATFADEIEAT